MPMCTLYARLYVNVVQLELDTFRKVPALNVALSAERCIGMSLRF